MKTIRVALLLLILCTMRAGADVQVNGALDLVARRTHTQNDFSNTTFGGANPFSSVRGRLFVDSKISENTSVFVQMFMSGYGDFRLYGAYVRFERLAGACLNVQAGKIPNTIGSFGTRTYAAKNSLIGAPVLHNYHVNINTYSLGLSPTVADLINQKPSRGTGGLALIYDFCWNTGLELYGSAGKFDYSLGVLAGSITKPTNEQVKDIPQFTGKVQHYFAPGLVLGGSGFIGPYLFSGIFPSSVPDNVDLSEYLNGGAGYEFHAVFRHLEIFSETFYMFWEYPNLPTLRCIAGYLEAKYKFLPSWYVASRFDLFEPRSITVTQSSRDLWDYPLRRIEVGIGLKPDRMVTIKGVTQINRFVGAETLNLEHYAVQVAIEFR